MRMIIVVLLLQALTAPDPAQMEKAPELGYMPIAQTLHLPDGFKLGAPAGVAINREGRLLVFNRGDHPLIEVDKAGTFVRSLGEGQYVRPHGLRVDAAGNIWTTDVNGHTVTKMSPQGQVLLVLGVKGQPGEWTEAADRHFLNEPNDVAIDAAGNIFVVQGHGNADPRVLKFDKSGKFIRSWGSKGSGPGQFDIAHSIIVDANEQVYVADRQNRRVQIFDADGKFIKEWKYLGLPCGLFIGPDRQMYLTSGFAGQILKLDTNGRAVAATGQAGKGLGEFGEAHYMTFGPAGEIYVADPVRATLHKFVRK